MQHRNRWENWQIDFNAKWIWLFQSCGARHPFQLLSVATRARRNHPRSMFYESVAVPVVDAGATWNGNFRHIFITEKIENFIYLVDAFGCLNNHYVDHKAFLVVWMASLHHAEFDFPEWWTRKSYYARVCHSDGLTLRSTNAFMCIHLRHNVSKSGEWWAPKEHVVYSERQLTSMCETIKRKT